MRVAWLGEPASLDEASVGGKTANLGRLAGSFRVPPGFCIDASVQERLGKAAEGDPASRAELRELLAAAYAELAGRIGAAEPAVAVRSSAIGEDAAGASFAGQHETVLDVRGVDRITEALLTCWRSVSSQRATAYRRERGIEGAPRVAVLVQQMVDTEIAAIAFSADPVSGARDVVLVNAARGLGDAIASGTVTPDSFTVRKDRLDIVERRVASTEPIADDDVRAIARLAAQLEAAMGWPVDIECARSRGELHLLQCRPITSLPDEFAVSWADPEDGKLHWRREDAHYTGPVRPLSMDWARYGPAHGINERNKALGLPMRVRMEAFNGRMYIVGQALADPAEIAARQELALAGRLERARRIREEWDERYLPELDAHFRWMRELAPERSTPSEAAGAWEELWQRISGVWRIHMQVTGGSYGAMDELAIAYERLVGGNTADALTITQGLADSLQRFDRDVSALTETARSLPAVGDAIRGGVRDLDALRRVAGGPTFVQAAERFLAAHGDSGQTDEQVGGPSWSDDHSLLLGCLAGRLEGPPIDPDARLRRSRARAEDVLRAARERLAGRPADLARFEDVVAVACAAGPLTEEHNYWLDRRVQANAGRAFLRFGARLVADGSLRAREEILLLHRAEVGAVLRAPRDLAVLIAERDAEQRRWRSLRAPEWLGAPPAGAAGSAFAPFASPPARVDLLHREAQDDATRVLRGVGASAGIVRGPARLIRDPSDFAKMRRGDVLVCRASNVSWIPLFTMACAVVTEVGGALSHAAVVAREFGVPCVVATAVALSTLSDDEVLEVDGAAGTVRRLLAQPVGSS